MTALVKANIRLVARVSPELHQMVNKAASLTGSSITQFLIDAATEKATAIIDNMAIMHLSKRDSAAVFDALQNPKKTSDDMNELWNDYKTSGLFDSETSSEY